jgi:hypothetical protein
MYPNSFVLNSCCVRLHAALAFGPAGRQPHAAAIGVYILPITNFFGLRSTALIVPTYLASSLPQVLLDIAREKQRSTTDVHH